MNLEVNNTLKKNNPNLTEIKSAVLAVTDDENYLVRLVKSENEFLSAQWDKTVGIVLNYKPNKHSEILFDNKLFIQPRKAVLLFQSFSNGRSVDKAVTWVLPKNGKMPIKPFLYFKNKLLKIFLVALFLIICFSLLVTKFTIHTEKTFSLIQFPFNFFSGLAFITLGLFGMIETGAYFFYKNEIIDIFARDSLFLLSLFSLFAGIFVLAAPFF